MDLNIAYSKNLTPFKPDYYEPSTNYSKDPINKNKNSCSTQYPSQNITNEIPKYKKLEKNLSRGSILNSVKSNIAKTINRSSSTITQTNSYTPRQTNSNNKDKNNYEDDNYNSILKTYRDFSKNTNKKNSTENFNNISCNYTNSNTNSSYLSKTINHQEDENRNCLKPEKKLRESIKNVIDLNLNIGRRKTDIGNNKTIDCDSRNLEILKIENIQNNNFHTLNKEDFYEESITNTGNRGNINRGLSPIPANFNPIQTSRAINNLITKNNSNKNFLEKIEKKNGSQLNLSPIDYETDTITINTEKSFIQDNKPFVNYSKPISFIKNISHGNNQNFNEENYFPEINCFKESNSNFSVKSLVNDIGNTHISNDHKDDEDLARKITSSGVINLNNLKDKIIPIKSNDFNYDNQISYNKNTKNSNYNNNIYNNEYENGIHSQRSSIISQESNHFNKEYLENFELKNNNFNNYKYSTDFSENIQPNPVRNQILDYNYIDYRQEYEKNINSLDNNLKKNGIYNNNSVLNNYNSNLNKSKSLLNETKKIINYSQGKKIIYKLI